jgi:hypothetical protein
MYIPVYMECSMKIGKVLVALSVLTFFLLMGASGCQAFIPLNPPSWILGTWADVGLNTSWTFTNDDAIWTTGITTFDFKQMRSTGVQVSDAETATTYTVSMGSGGVSQNYTFEKGDGTAITWVDMATGLLKQ